MENKSDTYIRSSKLTTKYFNTHRKKDVELFIDEYTQVTQFFVDYLWDNFSLKDKIPSLVPKEITSQVSTWLTARATQASAKQASGIVRGTRQKQKQREKMYEKLLKEGKTKQAKKLKKSIDTATISKPELKNVCPELDSRFVKFDLDNNTSFDGWITLTNLGNKIKIILPVKKSKHFNEMFEKGTIKKGIRLHRNAVTFSFEIESPIVIATCEDEKIIGIDIGQKDCFRASDGQKPIEDHHGHTLDSIQNKLARKQKGSKAFKKAQTHRKNYINMILNAVNFEKYNTIKIERLKNIRYRSITSRKLSHWTYTVIDEKIKSISETTGVLLEEVDPAYTSQRCSCCGWTRKRNRNGKSFVCTACGNTSDADHNAAINISLTLPAISRKQRRRQPNRKGFYWVAKGQEFIVPDVKEYLIVR
jgi:IS605 OrfB family transposase